MEKVILCFGDSNTWGYDVENGGRFDENTRYPRVLEKILNTGKKNKYRVIEEGLCGRTFAFDDPVESGRNGINYLKPCLESHSPINLLIIMLGTNDVNQRFCATANNIARAAGRFIDEAKHTLDISSPNCKILLVAPRRIGKHYESGLYSTSMGVGCHEKSVELINELKLMAENKTCYYFNADDFVETIEIDSTHLTRESHKILAEKLGKKIEEII